MAIKTTIGPKGVVSETTTGTEDQLVVTVDAPVETVTTVVSASSAAAVALTGGTTMLVAPAAAGVTCSLPALATTNVGLGVKLLLDSNGERVVVSGSDKINGSATLPTSGAYGVLDVVGVKSDDDGNFHWHILTQKQ